MFCRGEWGRSSRGSPAMAGLVPFERYFISFQLDVRQAVYDNCILFSLRGQTPFAVYIFGGV